MLLSLLNLDSEAYYSPDREPEPPQAPTKPGRPASHSSTSQPATRAGLPVELVDSALALAASAGGRILSPAKDAEWGGYSGYFADPDGYPWEVAWNPGFPFAADGSLELPE